MYTSCKDLSFNKISKSLDFIFDPISSNDSFSTLAVVSSNVMSVNDFMPFKDIALRCISCEKLGRFCLKKTCYQKDDAGHILGENLGGHGESIMVFLKTYLKMEVNTEVSRKK